MTKNQVVLFVLLFASLFTLTAQTAGEVKTAKSGDYALAWRIVEKKVEFTMSAPTTGWVALGIEPSSRMKDADFIIAYFKDGQGTISDDFGSSPTGHQPDTSLGGTADVVLVSSMEAEGKTTVVFTIPLKSGDKFDKVLEPGKTYKLLWAYGPNGQDNFRAGHRARGSLSITL